MLLPLIDCRELILFRQLDHLSIERREEWRCEDVDGIGTIVAGALVGFRDITARANLANTQLDVQRFRSLFGIPHLGSACCRIPERRHPLYGWLQLLKHFEPLR